MPGDDVQMKTVASLKMGDAIGSANKIVAVVIGEPEVVHGRCVKVPLAVFPGGEPVEVAEGVSQPVFGDRIYLNPGALVAVRQRRFPLDGLDLGPYAVAA